MSEEAEEILNQVIAGTSMHFNGAERDYIYRAMEKYKNLSSPQEVGDEAIEEMACENLKDVDFNNEAMMAVAIFYWCKGYKYRNENA